MHGEKYGEKTEYRRGRPSRPFIHPENPPTGLNQPEQQGRFVAVGETVDMWDEKLVALPHLPGNRQIPGFINGQWWAARQGDNKQDKPEQNPAVFSQTTPWHCVCCGADL